MSTRPLIDCLLQEIHLVGGQTQEKRRPPACISAAEHPRLPSGGSGKLCPHCKSISSSRRALVWSFTRQCDGGDAFGAVRCGRYENQHRDSVLRGSISGDSGTQRLCHGGARNPPYDAEGRVLLSLLRNYYTLAYIDKMWDILRREAFPKEIVL